MKFLADRMLGKLVKELRMLGYDTLYYQGEKTYPLIQLAREDGRVILTRNTQLIPKRPEDRIIKIQEDKPLLQVRELIQRGHLSRNEENLFSRCLLCNNLLHPVPREQVEGKVPDFIFYQQKDFYGCEKCSKIYWPGSHQDHMQKKFEELWESIK
jgi:uncharacterized protein with PIN domain